MFGDGNEDNNNNHNNKKQELAAAQLPSGFGRRGESKKTWALIKIIDY